MRRLACLLFALICLYPNAAFAKFGIHFSLKHPLSPITITVGHTAISPSPLGPNVHVDSDSKLANIVNKMSSITQAPATVAIRAVALPVNAFKSVKNLYDRIKNGISDAENRGFEFISWLKRTIPEIVIGIFASLFITIVLAVFVGTALARLVFRPAR